MRNAPPHAAAEVELVVPFHDLDPLAVVWHGNYARYFEHARTALLQGIDYDVPQMRASGYSWPVIELTVRYARPLTYQQRIRVRAELIEWENRMKIRYEIRDAANGERLTRGHTVQAAVELASGRMCFVSPPVLRDRLGLSCA
ncbi:acyl-CoA thioesterase [Chitiniphilus purpureus]|uniref:Acyl-CoA thioesterase n=1 Tax=Chitiniphilus purpureus TaxID=2981137 RepID=A0ABY6DVX8_9NEIS|nr:thioesterase family protein [Chitiniphilus sp. CD1]UXY16003.1 acyl-CoA thioesterase [Chitiniphilus sp. CD1]